VVAKDIEKKHKRMREGPFQFLRATFWRWAETILDIRPELGGAPATLAVGDIHVENFGTWRDAEGRLVWGVNDFDEAAEMPYLLDIVRLGASAALGAKRVSPERITASIVEGYREGLASPAPFVLDRDYEWMRKKVMVPEKSRAKFWKKMDPKEKATGAVPGPRFVAALAAAQPAAGLTLLYWPRSAGTGSLGRPRWVSYAVWRGAPALREAKAIVPSAWGKKWGGNAALRCQEVADGAYRSPDPWYRLQDRILVRRLSPNNHKIEIDDLKNPAELVNPEMLRAMGRDLGSVHRGSAAADAIRTDLDGRKPKSLADAVKAAADFTRREHEAWKKACK
jgi:hypothetical protein